INKKVNFFRDAKKNWMLYFMLIPTLIFFIVNNYMPMAGIYFAFTKFDFKGGLFGSPFVGLDNFKFLWKSNKLIELTLNTVFYNLMFILIGNVLQIFTAILISQLSKKWFKKITQTLMFMPYFVSYVILSVLVYNLFNYEYGLMNNVLKGMNMESINFYGESKYWPFLITLFYLWKSLGYGMVVYLATILGISKEFYEAAEVDGANIFQQIRYITLPQIKPTFIILLLFSLGNIMKGQFELFYQMVGNNGLLFKTTDIIDTYVYRTTLTSFDFGMGTAAGLYQSIFGFILIIVVNYLVKRKNQEYALF
ncbi:MAG: sugar transporter permease, partial [Anaerocolumna sp.]|nr:sugar transporter permease [Anaerocolumna sp.]